jgi:hypothetical protein
MKGIFGKNALIAIGYSLFFVVVSFFFDRLTKSIIIGFVFNFVGCIHFMIAGIFMAIYHFKENYQRRNGYMASFAFIWSLLLLVNVIAFY